MAYIFILMMVVGIAQIYLGFVGIEDWLGSGWALASLLIAIFARIMLPLTVGTYLAITNVYGLSWWIGIICAAPGILFFLPQFFNLSSDFIKRGLASVKGVERQENPIGYFREGIKPNDVDRYLANYLKEKVSTLIKSNWFLAFMYVFILVFPVFLGGDFYYLMPGSFSILTFSVVVAFGVLIVKRRMVKSLFSIPILSAFFEWFVFGGTSIEIFSPLVLLSHIRWLVL